MPLFCLYFSTYFFICGFFFFYVILFFLFCSLCPFPCSFHITVSYLRPHVIKSKEEGMACGSFSSAASVLLSSSVVKPCGISSVLRVQQIHTALTGLGQRSWSGKAKIYDGIDHSAKINCPPFARGIQVCKCQCFIHKMKATD